MCNKLPFFSWRLSLLYSFWINPNTVVIVNASLPLFTSMDAFFCILSYAVQTRYELNKKLIKCKLLLLEKKREKGVEKGYIVHTIYVHNWNGCFTSVLLPRVNNFNMFWKIHATVVRKLSTWFLVIFLSSVHTLTCIIIWCCLMQQILQKCVGFFCCTWTTWMHMLVAGPIYISFFLQKSL